MRADGGGVSGTPTSAARRPVDGALALLAALKPRVRIGIVLNNILDEQQAKIRLCGFDPYVDALVVSEVGRRRQARPGDFRASRSRRLACSRDDAVMVGDSWAADIEGARAAGIRPIWFNRSGRRVAGMDRATCATLSTLTPIDDDHDAPSSTPTLPSDRGAGLRCASA